MQFDEYMGEIQRAMWCVFSNVMAKLFKLKFYVVASSLIRGGPPCPCVVKKICLIHNLIPSPDRSWLCKARAAWVT